MAANNIEKTAPKTVTRPTNTTQYAPGDVINESGSTSMLQINLNVPNNFNAWMVGGQAISSVAQSSLQFDALFFSADIGTIAADNAAFDPTDDQLKDYYLGRISFASFVAYANNSIADGAPASSKPIVVTPNGTTVYVVLVATSAYQPASGEKLTVKFDFQPIND